MKTRAENREVNRADERVERVRNLEKLRLVLVKTLGIYLRERDELIRLGWLRRNGKTPIVACVGVLIHAAALWT